MAHYPARFDPGSLFMATRIFDLKQMAHTICLALYYLVIFAMCLFGLHRYVILYLYMKHRRNVPKAAARFGELPRVTVQLPVFNERYVVDRLLKSVKELDYPKDRLQFQMLDDSTDDTAEYTRGQVALLRAEGFQAEWVHRLDRTGYKAGALANGLETATGEFVMILDADFIVPPDFLQKTIHHFTDPKVGMVQTRWGHTNRNYSWLTRAQALFIDAHFVLEQVARSRSGRFFNFNGTGGIWRRSCIEDAGGWEHDTLTEDLDLSYRAQLRGWRFVYENDVVTPAELPVEMNGFKSQQHRWAKGSIQTCLKLMPALWRSPLPLRMKIEGSAHFTAYLICLLVVLFCLFVQPALPLMADHGAWRMALVDVPVFLLTSIPFLLFYFFAQREMNPRGWLKEMLLIPFLVALGAGVSINNARAVLEAFFGVKSGFVRTPKYGIQKKGQTWRRGRYLPIKSILTGVELAFAGYFAWLTWHAFHIALYSCLPFLALFTLGFIYVAAASVLPLLPRISFSNREQDPGTDAGEAATAC
jgi:cellulose synthase/poly-beta-1,6-N-acetylglucosamine synthase-like glycosyltransferase